VSPHPTVFTTFNPISLTFTTGTATASILLMSMHPLSPSLTMSFKTLLIPEVGSKPLPAFFPGQVLGFNLIDKKIINVFQNIFQCAL
jgi:hypothetical protein